MDFKLTRTGWSAALAVVVLLCGLLAPCLLLTAVGFGIERDDLGVNPHVQVQDQLRLRRASNIAVLGFILAELAATWALIKIVSRARLSSVRAGIQAALTFMGLSVLSYVIVIAALMGFAFDPLVSVEQVLEQWTLTLVG